MAEGYESGKRAPNPFDPLNATTPQGYRLAKD